MVDIAKCFGKGCPLKEKCYRYTVKGDPHWQSYIDAPRKEDGSCDMFWDDEEKIEDKKKRHIKNDWYRKQVTILARLYE